MRPATTFVSSAYTIYVLLLLLLLLLILLFLLLLLFFFFSSSFFFFSFFFLFFSFFSYSFFSFSFSSFFFYFWGRRESQLSRFSLRGRLYFNAVLVPPFISRGAPHQTARETSVDERMNYGQEMAGQI
jgi:hypothetical protein